MDEVEREKGEEEGRTEGEERKSWDSFQYPFYLFTFSTPTTTTTTTIFCYGCFIGEIESGEEYVGDAQITRGIGETLCFS